jgi:hypothetical protein
MPVAGNWQPVTGDQFTFLNDFIKFQTNHPFG